ncbi:MAG: hypothetical protein EBY84_03535, partial [Acidimicrobiia bacterium]|nr:hypothetical protein [Acidimicrobiia bacterium]
MVTCHEVGREFVDMDVNTTPRPFQNKVVLQRLLLVVALSVYSATVVANVSEPLVTAKRSESL